MVNTPIEDENNGPTQEWLRDVLVWLLNSARGSEKPDYSACAKFAVLLYKMLPSSKSDTPIGAEVRKMLQDEQDSEDDPDGQ